MVLRRTLSASEGDAAQSGNETNVDMRSKALQRYHELLKTDAQLQACAYDKAKVAQLVQCGTCIETLEAICRVYAERPAFGFCPPGEADWRTLTYQQFWLRVQAFAAGCTEVGAFQAEEFVGVCGFSSLDWVTAWMTDTYLGATTVPLPTNISAEDIAKISVEAEIRAMVCSAAELRAVAPILAGIPTLRTFIVMDLPRDMDSAASEAVRKAKESLPEGCKMHTMADLIARGEKAAQPPQMKVPGQEGHPANPIAHLLYTSGSTGLPKGAIFTEKLWHGYYMQYTKERMSNMAVISLGFLPLNHVMGQFALLQSMMSGGTTYFTRKSDMSTFFDDIRSVRPTVLTLIPRISNMLYDQFQGQLQKMQHTDSGADVAKCKQDLIEHFRTVECGGRVLTALTGSAPTAPEVKDFLQDALLIPITEGYGSTEAGYVAGDGELGDNVTEFKLVDVPELGYHTTNQPFPQGELLIKTALMIPGYFKHQEAFDEMLRDGMMETGDIMEQRGPRNFVWIDRKKNIMKLAQGEFVSVSRLEAVYSGSSPLIHQMYIYGSGLRSYLLAVVIPSPEAQAKASGEALKKLLRREIDDLARRKALQGYEIPRDFIVELDPFSKDNHLLTDSGKPARGKLKAKYGPVLEGIYTSIEERQKERQAAIRQQAAAGGSVADKVKQAAVLTLGVSEADVGDAEASFGQLGGDSLAAIQFAREVSELCGVSLPVSFVLDHSHSLRDITEKVEQLLSGEGSRAPTFAKIHGNNGDVIKAADLDLMRFAPEKMPKEVTEAIGAESLPPEPVGVLLTGANGFLGRFLLLDLLKRVSAQKGGRVVAMVRGASDEAAWSRLMAGYDSGDPDLKAAFAELSEGRLSVYAGDLSKPNLGLGLELYKELASSLDTVVHNGALVNHAFTYEQLFEPNVLGSLEVMKFCARYRRKALTFISSVGVLAGLDHPQPTTEEEVGTRLCTEHPGSDGYALGYGCSKWATEVQLQQLHEQFGVPVSIFRCGMILAHSKYLGQINVTDNFTRLLASLVYTGIAPTSFYEHPDGPDRHYDGMPIDFVAEGIAGIASGQRSGLGMYHVVNPHWDDNISLDTIVGWVETAGYKLARVADYGAWYARFKAGLEALDHRRQASSSLPIVYQWQKPMSGPVSKFDATQMRKGVRARTHWQDVPHLSEEFIHQNLRHLVALRIIDPPPTQNSRQD